MSMSSIALRREAEPGGVERGLRAARKASLAEQIADVDADSFLTDRQRVGDLPIIACPASSGGLPAPRSAYRSI